MPKLASLFGLLLLTGLVPPALAGKTHNVVLIVSDGLRWQEVFQGADPLLLDARTGGNWVEEPELKSRYWRATPQERRQLLFPFIWGTVAKRPDTAPLGERKNVEPVTQAQIAATLAALVGKDYVKDVPKAARPIRDVLAKGS